MAWTKAGALDAGQGGQEQEVSGKGGGTLSRGFSADDSSTVTEQF